MRGRLVFLSIGTVTLVLFYFLLRSGKTLYFKAPATASSATRMPALVTPIPTPEVKILPGVNNWVSYKNNQYGFSLLYPATWQLLDEQNVFGIEIQNIDKNGFGVSFSVRIDDNPQKLTVKQYAETQIYNNGKAADTPELIHVDNLEGYKLNVLPPGILMEAYLPYKENKILYVFAGGSVDSARGVDINSYNQIFLKMLNSLKIF